MFDFMRRMERSSEPVTLFFHLPKTGGLTIGRHLEKYLDPEELICAYPHPRQGRVFSGQFPFHQYLAGLSESKRSKIKMLYGHIIRPDEAREARDIAQTCLRGDQEVYEHALHLNRQHLRKLERQNA